MYIVLPKTSRSTADKIFTLCSTLDVSIYVIDASRSLAVEDYVVPKHVYTV